MIWAKAALEKIWWLLTEWLSDRGNISFGRGMSALIVFYFLIQDAWFFHRSGHLVDNSTLLTQAGLMTMFYLQTSAKQAIMNVQGGKSDPSGQ